MNEDSNFTEKVKVLDTLLLECTSLFDDHFDSLFDNDKSPIPQGFEQILPLLRELAQWDRLGESLFIHPWSGHGTYINRLAHYPTEYESCFVRLGKFVELLLDDMFDPFDKRTPKPEIHALAESHKNPFSKDLKSALAALYVKLESAAIAEETLKQTRTATNATPDIQTPQSNGENPTEAKAAQKDPDVVAAIQEMSGAKSCPYPNELKKALKKAVESGISEGKKVKFVIEGFWKLYSLELSAKGKTLSSLEDAYDTW